MARGKKAVNKGGRPTVMTKEVVNKLEYVFGLGGTDEEACFYADISKQTLYDYCKKHPKFIDRKESLKQSPILTARITVINSLSSPDTAKWYLERKKKDEFTPRHEVDMPNVFKTIDDDKKEFSNE